MSQEQLAEIEKSRAQARLSAEKFEKVFQATEPTGLPRGPIGPPPEARKHQKIPVEKLEGFQRPMTAKQKKFFRPKQPRARRPGRPFTLKSLGGTGYYSPGPRASRKRVPISGRAITVIPGKDGEALLKLRKRAQIIEEKKELARLRKNDAFFYRQHPYYLNEAERMA